MIEATIILGEEAVARYNETNELPSGEWLADNGGVVLRIDFRTEAEYDAYVRALSDGHGWNDYQVIKHEQTPQDCPFCRQWREYFADRETTVYCSDCGQPILNINSI